MPHDGEQTTEEQPSRGKGRPTLYDPEQSPLLARYHMRGGATREELAAHLGVSLTTLYEWQSRYPDFAEAIKTTAKEANLAVEDSLYKRAMGYEYEEVETVITGEGERLRKQVKKTVKRVAPDVTAQIFWLKNRERDRWRDKHDLEHTGKDGGPIEVAYDPRDELMRRVTGLVGAAGSGQAGSRRSRPCVGCRR